MAGRFDLRPLFYGVLDGLRHRGEEPESVDWATRSVLTGAPIAALIACVAFDVQLTSADQLLAGVALLAGALLAAFAQVGSWRERILQKRKNTDDDRVAALNEAAAHILLSIVVSLFAMAVVIVLANLDPYAAWTPWTSRVLSGLGVAALTYLGLVMIIVVNLLWDAYGQEPADAAEDHLPDFESGSVDEDDAHK
jgi:hypothetical protein